MNSALPRYRGRLAPSPTGRLHFGIARTFLLAWLCARRAGGDLILRIEDLDAARTVWGAAQDIAADLRFLGLDWDEGPDSGGPFGPYAQSERADAYAAAVDTLEGRGLVFECSCSRADVARAGSAPHGELGPGYPGTCYRGPTQSGRARSLRFRMPAAIEAFDDLAHGRIALDVRDDFVVRRSDGQYAYQLAVVVDDHAMGVTHVVRGDDLLSSTPRQLALYRALGYDAPTFMHVPLVIGPDGRRLAKRHGSLAIAELRARGFSAARIVGLLAASLGLCATHAAIHAADLLDDFDIARLPKSPTVLAPEVYFTPS